MHHCHQSTLTLKSLTHQKDFKKMPSCICYAARIRYTGKVTQAADHVKYIRMSLIGKTHKVIKQERHTS